MRGLALVLALMPLAASAATIVVTSNTDTIAVDGRCTLREAIGNVNAAADVSGGDCAAGTGSGDSVSFNLPLPATIRLALGQLSVQKDVTIAGPGANSLRIDGVHRTRVFEIVAGTSSMSDLTIRGGRGVNRGDGFFVGGGLLVDTSGTLTLTNCVLTRNVTGGSADADEYYSGRGAAIYNAGALALNSCTLVSNTAGGPDARAGQGEAFGIYNEAGGIYNDDTGTLSLTNCLLSGNRALSGYAGISSGGAIANAGTMTLSNCTITRNQARVVHKSFAGSDAESGGGGIANWGFATLTDCTLSNNLAGTGVAYTSASGGGIDNNGTITVKNSTFIDNSARGGLASWAAGGAIATWNNATLSNCTLNGNSVRTGPRGDSYAGGIFRGVGSTTVTNCTLSNNVASGGGYGPGAGGISGDGDITVTNSIIVASGSGGNCSEVTSGGHNIDDDGTCFTTGGTDLPNTDPHLAPLRNYGGPTKTRMLCTAAQAPHPACTVRSPAIDAGDDAVTGPPENLTTDQRGQPRLVGGHVDIGACEAL